MTQEEIILVEQAKNGSDEAFNRIYRMHLQPVKAVIRQFYKQPEIVDEIVNITFLKVHKKLDSFVTNDSLKSWLCTIANNSCIDYKRKQNRSRMKSIDDESSYIQIPSTVPNAEESIIKSEEVRKLQKFIKKLPEKQQRMLHLFYFEGKLYREIADMLALPLGTVQSDLNRAKHKLKKLLT